MSPAVEAAEMRHARACMSAMDGIPDSSARSMPTLKALGLIEAKPGGWWDYTRAGWQRARADQWNEDSR